MDRHDRIQVGNSVRIFEKGRRDPRTAELVRIFKRDAETHGPPNRSEFLRQDPRTAESVRIFKKDAGIHGPPNRSEFLKKDPRTAESVWIFKRDAGFHGPPFGRNFWKGGEGIHGPSIW